MSNGLGAALADLRDQVGKASLSRSSMWWALDALPQPGGRVFYLSYDAQLSEVSEPVYGNGGKWQNIPADH
ncbi:hypothetical protein [Nonomuraea ferruginea]|uniref:Uncharacterized protein n=1 Tax=Nonomuraea ferruginea TaxID=46174 RepID=A0ABT4TCP8_9ACTN|nr:hypothetical protein [Nonomuraea ferruginea]MDA0647277.1 hypothetical protein [Nonomuraea ferruginea]